MKRKKNNFTLTEIVIIVAIVITIIVVGFIYIPSIISKINDNSSKTNNLSSNKNLTIAYAPSTNFQKEAIEWFITLD